MTQSRRLITLTLLSITSLIGGAAFIKHYKKGSVHRQIPEFFQHPAPYISVSYTHLTLPTTPYV